MRKVVPGESMLPHFTAPWFNQTINLDKKFGTGNQSRINTNHQNIIYCINEGSDEINYFDPVQITSRIVPETIATPCYCIKSVNSIKWGVAQQVIKPGATGKVVIFGATLANITYPPDYLTLTYPRRKVFSGPFGLLTGTHGPAELLTVSIGTPSLITIGNYEKREGKAYLPDGASPREGAALGFGFGEEIVINYDNELVATGDTVTVMNDSTEPIKRGYVQYKEVTGKLLIDVAPCFEEDPVH